jgi:hypothetical protein
MLADCHQAADVTVLFDVTNSMDPGNLDIVKYSLENLVDQFQVQPSGYHMSVVTFR